MIAQTNAVVAITVAAIALLGSLISGGAGLIINHRRSKDSREIGLIHETQDSLMALVEAQRAEILDLRAQIVVMRSEILELRIKLQGGIQ